MLNGIFTEFVGQSDFSSTGISNGFLACIDLFLITRQTRLGYNVG